MGNTTPTAISLAPPLLPLPHPCITRERVKRVKRAAQSEFHFARLHLVLAKAGLPAVESRRSKPIPPTDSDGDGNALPIAQICQPAGSLRYRSEGGRSRITIGAT